ncbi:hypothetical protein TTHERM_00058230 (macronuclear) [Tetrahymena thermophila SB210]|uniref:Uncharacterized protein n=1 Tax=Tetrahymena thermophila (strain SB210) TaxID=312017 RepID=I7LTU5_TETTS|nr:hypothetical protein TTHERM_00058230 [Tetrahymena thermophila SB210]EAR87311.2 hypothetical protein TTHERM_00058230 [Tetrahymena thermophila SB210]|eukprot:XP_001007556.2 hypothetical protein TTHERM_00058230 [Tetrahymena thermophila SB210]
MNVTSDESYQIYSASIPFQNYTLLNNPKIKARAIGFMTGFSISSISQQLDVQFEISSYQTNNNSIMMNMYQEKSYEFIQDRSNCLFNNVIQDQYLQLNSTCKIGLSGDDIQEKCARVQTSKTPISVQHMIKQDFAIGFSKISCNLSAQNPRIVLYDFTLSNNTIQITYYTWQGSQVLGVTSTIIELYSLSCPTGFFYSFADSDCVNSCEQQTYQEQNLSNNNLLPTCSECDTSCQNCIGPLPTNCTACSQQYPYNNTRINNCVSKQPQPGFICQQSPNNYPSYQYNCYPCQDKYCNNCTNITPNSCSQCQPNYYLYNQNCQLTKPSPAYCNNQNICQDCTIQFCQNCDQGPQICSSCAPSFFFDQNTSQCKCPSATFLDSNNAQCISCPINCAICQSSIDCQVCASDSLKDPLNPGKFASIVLHNALLVLNLNLIVNHVKLVLKQNQILCLIKMNALVLIRKIHQIKQLEIVNNVKILCASSVISIIEISVYNAYSQHNFHKLIRNVCVPNQPITHKAPIVAFNVLKQIVWNVYLMDLSAFNVKVGSFLITGTILVAFANQKNQCLECSSSTRIIDLQTKSCACKPSFIETNQKDCQFSPKPNILFEITSIMTSIQYFIYLPTLFINHHPFSDYFLMNSQLIGNQFYSQQHDQVGIFACNYAKFNYFNLHDSQILVFSYDLPSSKDSSILSNLIAFFGSIMQQTILNLSQTGICSLK